VLSLANRARDCSDRKPHASQISGGRWFKRHPGDGVSNCRRCQGEGRVSLAQGFGAVGALKCLVKDDDKPFGTRKNPKFPETKCKFIFLLDMRALLTFTAPPGSVRPNLVATLGLQKPNASGYATKLFTDFTGRNPFAANAQTRP